MSSTVASIPSTQPVKSGSAKRGREGAILPKYRQVEYDLRQRIETGQWTVGTMLPGRAVLASQYAVDLTTLQRAIGSLLDDGTLRADARRGTFVANAGAAAATVNHPSAPKVAAIRSVGIVASSAFELSRVQEIDDEWARTILASLEQVFAQQEVETHFVNRRNSATERSSLRECVAPLVEQGITSIVVAGVTEQIALDDELAECRSLYPDLNLVLIGWHAVPFTVSCVFYDSQMAGYQAARHLLERGHRSLAFFMPWDAPWAMQRWDGIRRAVRQAGLPDDAARLLPGGDLPPETQDGATERAIGYAAARKLLEAGEVALWGTGAGDATGVIAANDEVAIGIQKASAEFGRIAGTDFALMGFDDCPIARQHGLTSMRPPLESLGEEAAKLLLRGMNAEDPFVSGVIPQVRLASRLVPRASTRLRPQSASIVE